VCWHNTRQVLLALQCLGIIRVRALLSLESLFRAFSALVLFECGRSCPSNRFLWASSASIFFECTLWSHESFSLGQQCLYIIRVRASVPRIALFGPVVPLQYSSVGSGPSNYFLRIFDASTISGLRSLELFPLDLRRLYNIRVRASIPRIIFFGPAAPPYYLSAGFGPSSHFLWASSASVRVFIPRISSRYQGFHLCLKYGGNRPIRMPYVKYDDKSTVSNTRWTGIRIKRALPR
jgi:hypothetical protein